MNKKSLKLKIELKKSYFTWEVCSMKEDQIEWFLIGIAYGLIIGIGILTFL